MEQFWVFGYGSLMWRPGFSYTGSEPALVRGYHRKLCVYSHVHRGTPERPGLVLGLDRGGSCRGMAFRIEPSAWEETLAYLRSREQVTMVYVERHLPVTLLQGGATVKAVTFVVDRMHRQYTGPISDERQLEHVQSGEGISGRCVDYVMNTVAHLRDMQIRDETLERLVRGLAPQASIRA